MELRELPEHAVLCYIDGDIAYFTTQELSQQWGDDWNDSAFEHNAERPYTYTEFDVRRGKKPWDIVELRFHANLEQPDEWYTNSPYSVEQINAKAVPWLQTGKFGQKDANGEVIQIWAGTTLADFVQMIHRAQGVIYWPVSVDEQYQNETVTSVK